jgi:2-oxo-4-hydroxy-4-carboxy--5-ureidoimidazoline (OHCU) decarboxylase
VLPKAGAVVAGIPHPVLGGAALAMFATVAVVGIQTLTQVDFHDHRNVVIVATSLGLALFVTAQPDIAKAVPSWAEIIFGSGITLGSLTAIVLNAVFHHVGRSPGPAVAGEPSNLIRLSEVNEMSREQFLETFGGLFPGPGWVVERAYDRRPFDDTRDLRQSFQEALFTATDDEQRQLVGAYPGLDGPDHAEVAEVAAHYRQRFGFPLVASVRDRDSVSELLEQAWLRLENSPAQEQAAALVEIAKIGSRRFDELVADANPIHAARTGTFDGG